MTDKLSTALDTVEMTYGELVDMANSFLSNYLNPINELVNGLSETVNELTTDQLRDYILKLQLKAFEVSELKDKAAFKAELADAVMKEQLAINFNSHDGAVATKDKLALVETSGEILAQLVCELVSDLLKTKVDQLHRLVSALTSVLSSRTTEAKYMNMGYTSEIPATTNGRITLNE